MKYFATLRSILMVLVVAAIAPLFGFSVVNSLYNSGEDMQRATKNLEFTASTVALAQERVADSARQLLVSISKVPRLADKSAAECTRYVKSLQQDLLAYAYLGVISKDGKVLCHTATTGLGDDISDSVVFQSTKARSGFFASGYTMALYSKQPIIAFGLPVLDGQQQPVALVFASLIFPALGNALSDVKLPTGGSLIVMDRDGIVLADNSKTSTAVGLRVSSPLLQQAVTSVSTGLVQGPDIDGVHKIYAVAQTGSASDSAFFVAVGLSRDEVLQPHRRQLALELMALLMVAGLGCLMAWLVGGRAIIQPTIKILKASQDLQAGQPDVRIPLAPHSVDHELVQIASAFNQMAETIQQRETELKLGLQRSEQAKGVLDVILNSLQDGLVAVDAEGCIFLINPAALLVFALEPAKRPVSELWTQRLGLFVPGTSDLYDLEDLPLYKALRGNSGGPQRIWVKNDLSPEGRLISAHYSPITDAQGKMGGLMVFSDITELDRLQHEQAENLKVLRQSQRQLLEAQRLGRSGNWQMDPISLLTTWSPQAHAIFGMLPGSFDGRLASFLRWVHPDDRDLYVQRRTAALHARTELDVEYRIVTPGADMRWVHQLGQVRLNGDGQAYFHAGVVQEITARKQDVLNLARSTELLQRTGQMATIGGWEVSFNPLSAHWTEQLYRIHELETGDTLTARQAIRFFAPEARPAIMRAIRCALENGSPWDLELSLITAKGQALWVRMQGQPLHRDGKLVGLSGALQDITSQHNAQQHLRLLETCISRLNDVVLITEAEPVNDPGPRIVFVNDAFERITGYSRAEVMGKSPRFLQGPKTQRAELNRIDAALKKWQPVRAELINYTKTGEEFWIELDIVPVVNDQGVNSHWVSVERDITQRKLAEQAMRDSEQRYAALFEHAPQLVWTADTQGRATYLNRACFDLLGGEMQDWEGKKWFSAVHPEDLPGVKASWAIAEVSQMSFSGTRRLRAQDGAYHTMAYRASPVFDAENKIDFWVCIDADVTEIKAIEAALRLSHQEMETFSYSVSHDLRSPLNTIDGFSRLLTRQLGSQVGEKERHYLSRIQAGVAQMGKLIEDLLELAHVSRLPLQNDSIDLSAMCRHLLRDLRLRDADRDVAEHIEDGLCAYGDNGLLGIVLENLLGNAWKFTSGLPHARIRVGQHLDAAGQPVFFVGDNGAGFDMAYAGKLFMPFQRLHLPSEFPGSGIGLATASRAIARQGGTLWAEAAVGQGATFFFTLPRSAALG